MRRITFLIMSVIFLVSAFISGTQPASAAPYGHGGICYAAPGAPSQGCISDGFGTWLGRGYSDTNRQNPIVNFYGNRGDCGDYDYQIEFHSGDWLNDQIKSFETGTHCGQTKTWQNSDYTGDYTYCYSAISAPPYGDCASHIYASNVGGNVSYGVSALHWYGAP